MDTVRRLVKEASSQQIDLLILPELWATGYDLSALDASANAFWDINNEIQSICKELGIAIAGTYVRKQNDKLYNSLIFHTPNTPPIIYNKIHLFGLTGEGDVFDGGNDPTIVDYLGWRLGLSVCYDLRFPELFRLYRKADVDLMIVSAAWPEVRLNHWQILSQARAIENQYYIAACNQVGECKGAIFGGHSMFLNPLGEIQASLLDQENALITTRCDPTILDQVRAKMPVHEDIKPFLFDELAD